MNTAKRTRRQRGANTVEFGLSFLLFFFLMYGIMEFGRVVASYNMLSGATREGARYAVVHGSASGSTATATDIQNIVRRWGVGLDSSSLVVTTTWNPGNGPGGKVNVKATYTLQPFTALILHKAITLQSTSQMVISQ
jgi:Flp pilus assembly protein TadG